MQEKELVKLFKEGNYFLIYHTLKEEGYDYTIENIETDFKKIATKDKYCYFIRW